MNERIYRVLVLAAGLIGSVLLCGAAEAACSGSSPNRVAANASRTEVLNCVSAAATGDTITVPAGSATWTSPIDLPATKDLTIIGATVVNCSGSPLTCSSTDRTVLTCSGPFCFTFDLGATQRVSGFTMTVDGGLVTGSDQNIAKHFRIDHNKVTGTDSFTQMWLPGNANGIHPQGVVDNNLFISVAIRPVGTNHQWEDSCSNCQDRLWAQQVQPGGGGDRVFIETNEFRHDSQGIQSSDSNYGGRYVYRFNNASSGFHNSEVHGMQGTNRGSQLTEIYHNTFTAAQGSGLGGTTNFRGGTGVIFNNTQSFAYNYGVDFTIDRSEYDEAPGNFGSVRECGSGGPDGNSPAGVDQQTAGQNGWRCRDQVGTWYDPVLWTHSATGPPFGAWNQVQRPVYIWGNKTGSGAMAITVNGQGDIQNKIQPSREFYCDAGLLTPGSCNNGVRVGAIAGRPSTCTTGQAYWATDQGEWNTLHPGPDGQLYRCTATNTWALDYTPYQYPHPWTQGGGGDTTIPSAPPQPIVN